MKPFRRVRFSMDGLVAILGRLQDSIEEVIKDIQKDPSIDGHILENVLIEATGTDVPHKLGRRLQGWYIVRQRASATIWDNQDSNTQATKYLALQASADVYVDIKVF